MRIACCRFAQQLLLQPVLTDLEVVRARAPVKMLRTTTIHGVPSLPTRHDYQIASAQAAFKKTGEQITTRSRAVQQTLMVSAIKFGHPGILSLDELPEFLFDNSQFRTLTDPPFAARAWPRHSPVGSWHFCEPGTVPYHPSDIQLSPQHLADSGRTPARLFRGDPGAWRRHLFAV